MTITDLPVSTSRSRQREQLLEGRRGAALWSAPSRTYTPPSVPMDVASSESLPLAAGRGRDRLASPQIAEARIGHALQNRVRRRHMRPTGLEEADRIVHRQVEPFGDVCGRRGGTPGTDAWNRRPSQSSQTVETPAIMPKSVSITPAPLHVGHTPCGVWR